MVAQQRVGLTGVGPPIPHPAAQSHQVTLAVEFLERFAPEGPWCLGAIMPSGGAPDVATFGPATRAKAVAWIESRIGRWNCYFTVGDVARPMWKKPERSDIAKVTHFHVDIDPQPKPKDDARTDVEWLDAEQERILRRLLDETERHKSVPEPSVVVFSGGGYQAFWKLREPISIDGDVSKADDVSRYNKQLETLLGGDSCGNIDRLMRLPFTENIPDAKKAAKGRQRAWAEVAHRADGAVYDLSRFKQAPMPGRKSDALKTVEVDPTQEVRRLKDISELAQWGVGERLQIIAMQGRHPEKPKDGDDSRSAWLFDFVCGAVREKVPDDVIYSVITDPECGISDSVLENGRGAHAYAIKQIESAKECVEADPQLMRLNRDYAVVAVGGKTLVGHWGPSKLDDGEREVFQTLSFQDFRNRHSNEQVAAGKDSKGNPRFEELGNWWLKHPRRRQYLGGVRYAPGESRDLGHGFLNLWTGWPIKPRQGDWSLMRQHIDQILAGGNPEHAAYINRWCAWAVQNPGRVAEVALVLVGGRGAGKGAFCNSMLQLFGRHGIHATQQEHVTGRFSGHLEYASLLFADEAFAVNVKQVEATLKGLVTEPSRVIERKGLDAEPSRNCVKMMVASNDAWVVPAGPDERRWAVFRVSDSVAQKRDYFRPLFAQMADGGLAAWFHDMLAMDLGDWHPRDDVPQTEELAKQKALTLRGLDRVMYQLLASGSVLGCLGRDEHGNRFFAAGAMIEKHDALSEKDRRGLGLQLRAASLDGQVDAPRCRVDGVQHRGRWLPPLQQARESWARRRGLEWIDWSDDVRCWEDDDEPAGENRVPF